MSITKIKASAALLAALMTFSFSATAEEQKVYHLDIRLNEEATSRSTGEDWDNFRFTVVTQSNHPAPFSYSNKTSYLLDAESVLARYADKHKIDIDDVNDHVDVGLIGSIIANPEYAEHDNSERVSMSLMFSYTSTETSPESELKTSTISKKADWTSAPGKRKSIPFEVGGKEYLLEITATPMTLTTSSTDENQYSHGS